MILEYEYKSRTRTVLWQWGLVYIHHSIHTLL